MPSASGADFTCLGLPDMEVSRYTPEDVERLTAFLLARPPDLVLTHWLEDTHPDHVASVRLVIEALLHYAVSHGLEDVDASRRAFPPGLVVGHVWWPGESRGLCPRVVH